MKRELLVASFTSTAWILISFVFFAICYHLIGEFIGHFKLMEFERLLGEIEYVDGLTIPRLALVELGCFMFIANIPINYYWMRRLKQQSEERN